MTSINTSHEARVKGDLIGAGLSLHVDDISVAGQ
jgi:hypothetical protein